ncbi:MAG: hypothetical protein M9893_09765 [Pyrinomonadaceae bacterium]|nr:hypothetical protein [Pyrinomonadaceae bacterium]
MITARVRAVVLEAASSPAMFKKCFWVNGAVAILMVGLVVYLLGSSFGPH